MEKHHEMQLVTKFANILMYKEKKVFINAVLPFTSLMIQNPHNSKKHLVAGCADFWECIVYIWFNKASDLITL